MKPIPHYSDPGTPSIVSDDEDSKDENENNVNFSTKKITKIESISNPESPNTEPSRTSEPAVLPKTQLSTLSHQNNLLGILELSKFFCHDNQEDHNSEIECGVASGLATLLRRSLFIYDQARAKKVRSDKFKTNGLEYIVSLSTSLTMVLHCSGSVLGHHIQEFESDLVPALESVVSIFGYISDEDSILTQVVLTNVCRIIALVHRYLFHRMEEFVNVLLRIVNGDSTPNIVQVDAASTLCEILDKYPLETNPNIVKLVESNASTLISVISTASVPLSDETKDPTLRLYDLAAMSKVIRVKMMKRRCVLLGITRHFRHASSEIRRKAYTFCKELVDHPESSNSFSSNVFLENRLVETVAAAAIEESDADIQLLAVSLLRKITTMQPFPSKTVMEHIRTLAFSTSTDDIVNECGAVYCEGMQKEPFPTTQQISTVVEFTTFSLAKVRSKAFEALETLLIKSESVEILLQETSLLASFAGLVSDGSDEDCEAALNIVRQLSRSSRHHDSICLNPSFLESLIDFVAKETITNRKAHFYGVEIILALLSNDETTQAFLPFRQLLPWLVSFLNRTTADDVFKEQVVAVIIRLSTAYLELKD